MLLIGGILAVFVAVVGLVSYAYRLAGQRDRATAPWTLLTLAAAVAAAYGSWRWLASSLDSDAGLLLAAFSLLIGTLVAPGLVVLALHRLPPGRPRISGQLAVRLMGKNVERLWLMVAQDVPDGQNGLVLRSADGTEWRIAGSELERIQADGECLRLLLRPGGDELRLQVIEFADLRRRRRTCEALAAALSQQVAPARVVSR